MTFQVQRSAACGVRGADLRPGPADGLLEQPEGVLKIESAQVGPTSAVDVGTGG
jgi:hypothetical protein